MSADRSDFDTGAGYQDASDGTEDTMPLTHTMATLLAEPQRMEICGDFALTACSGLRVMSMKTPCLSCTRWPPV